MFWSGPGANCEMIVRHPSRLRPNKQTLLVVTFHFFHSFTYLLTELFIYKIIIYNLKVSMVTTLLYFYDTDSQPTVNRQSNDHPYLESSSYSKRTYYSLEI